MRSIFESPVAGWPGPRRDRVASALASLGVVVAIGAALVMGLRPGLSRLAPTALAAFDLSPEPKPPPPPTHVRAKSHAPAPPRAAGAQSAPTELPPVPILIPPIPVIALPDVHSGEGASIGQGAGSGAAGSGTGGGGIGGTGDDSGDGIASEATQIKGRLSPRDLPDGALPPGGQLSVGVSYQVGIDGRVGACAITRSSGDPAVDARVCQLLTDRFRYRPARSRAGQPVPSTIRETHSWARKADARD